MGFEQRPSYFTENGTVYKALNYAVGITAVPRVHNSTRIGCYARNQLL